MDLDREFCEGLKEGGLLVSADTNRRRIYAPINFDPPKRQRGRRSMRKVNTRPSIVSCTTRSRCMAEHLRGSVMRASWVVEHAVVTGVVTLDRHARRESHLDARIAFFDELDDCGLHVLK